MRQLKLVFLLLVSTPTLAQNIQAHLKGGMVNGTFTGAVSGDFSVATSIEGEGEYVYSSRLSLFSRATVALEAGTGQFKYIYMGLGHRYYFFSRSGYLEESNNGLVVSITPRIRYFAEGLLGLSQVQVRAVTDTLVAQSTLLEYGGGAGVIYQLSKSLGVEGTMGVSKGFAVSSVAVDTLIIRGFIGLVSTF